MKNIMIALIALSSFSVFAEGINYEGHGKRTSYGTEVCGMIITQVDGDKLELEVYALGSSTKTIVQNSAEIKFDIKNKTVQFPEAGVEASGKIVNGQPVSFKFKLISEMSYGGKIITHVEKMKCNF